MSCELRVSAEFRVIFLFILCTLRFPYYFHERRIDLFAFFADRDFVEFPSRFLRVQGAVHVRATIAFQKPFASL